MNNQIQLVLKSSTAEMPLNDQALGIYLTPELDGLVGLPEIRTTSGVNAGYDGGWTSAQNYDARSITIRGVIANGDVATVERLRKQLVSLAGQGKSEELTLNLVTEAGNAYTLQVRTIALEMSMQSVLTQQQFMLQLRADDPLIYDAGESEHEATLQVAKATGGFTIDFELPLAITGGSEESVVNNDGLEEVPTIVKMYGALHNPKIINQTNNEQMQIMTDLGFAEGAWNTPSEASEGTSISLANTPDSAPFSDIQLKGDTYQNGTPTPSAPVAVQTVTGENTVKICGKNLLKLPSAGTNDGITYSVNSDGTFNVHGTNNSGGEILFSLYLDSSEFQSVDYTLGAREALPYGLGCRCEIYSGGTWRRAFVSVNYSRQTQTGTPDFTNANRVRVAIAVANGATVNIDNVGIQLEKGSSASSFEPYQGQSYEINLGKNLVDTFNMEFTSGGGGLTLTHDTDGAIVINGTASDTYNNIRVNMTSILSQLVGQSVALSISTTGTGIWGNWGIKTPNNDIVVMSSGATTKVATLTASSTGEYWVDIYFNGSSHPTFTDYNIKLQIEKGTQVTTYAPYFAPIELCKIGDYQDYIWKDGDTWKVHKEVGAYTVTGNESIGIYNGMVTVPNTEALQGQNNHLLSDHFIYKWANEAGACYISAVAHTINFGISGVSTASAAEEWAAANTPKFYYLLATPTDTAITNEALIAQLDDLLNLSRTYQGQTNLADLAASGNMPAILDVSYFTEQDPDTRDELIIDSRLHTVTLNGLDIYHLIGEGSEFLMLEPGENRLSLQSDITGDNGYAVVSYKQGYLSI